MDRKIEKKKWTLKKIFTISLVSTFSIIILWQILLGDHSSKLNVKTERITISTVRKDSFQEFIPITGTVIPIKTVYLDAVEGGSVETIYLEAGHLVKKGDAILKLENTDLMLNILYREADLAEQSNALRNTRLEMERRRLDLRLQLTELTFRLNNKREYTSNRKSYLRIS